MSANIALKRVLGRVVRLPRPAPRKFILLYHSVGDTPWALPEAQFRAQLAWLAEVAHITTLGDMLAGASPASPQVALSFDDGYATLHDIVRPILRAMGAAATVFVNTGRVADLARTPSDPSLGHYPQESFLSWRDIVALASAGWSVGSHGVDHLDLTRASPAVVREQLKSSQIAIELRLSSRCEYFSYPWGRHNQHLRRAVAEAGYRYAVCGEHRPVLAGDDPFMIARINIANDYSLADFKAIVRGDWDYLGWMQRVRNDWAMATRPCGLVS